MILAIIYNNTIRSLQNLLGWVSSLLTMSSRLTSIYFQKSLPKHTNLRQLVYDGHRFAQYFPNTIKKHPLLLYITALPFTPANTSIHKKFYHTGLPKVVCGLEKLWPRQLQLFRGGHDHSIYYSVVFSPDGSKIASGSWDNTIRVWDARSGVKTLPPI